MHTPGPWETSEDQFVIRNVDGETVAPHVLPKNARLIAAAPELLEALKVLIPLVARGMIEGAYDSMAGGRSYADRVLTASESTLAKATIE